MKILVVKWLRRVSQSKSRMFEAHHDPCSLLEGETALPSPIKNSNKKIASKF